MKTVIIPVKNRSINLPHDFLEVISVRLIKTKKTKIFLARYNSYTEDNLWHFWVEPLGDKMYFVGYYPRFFVIRWILYLKKLIFPDKIELTYLSQPELDLLERIKKS